MMQHPFIDENEIVTRYLGGELGADEEASFEEHLLICAACQDEIEADERIGTALRSLEATGDLPAADPPPAGERTPRRTRARAWQPLAWAASILFALLPAFFLLRENTRLEEELRRRPSGIAIDTATDGGVNGEIEALRGELEALRSAVDDATQPRVGLPLLRLEPVRSEGETPYRLTLGEEPEWIVLLIEPPEPLGESYALTLESPGGERRAFEVDLDAYGTLTLSLYSADIEAGIHRLEATSAEGAPFATTVEIRH